MPFDVTGRAIYPIGDILPVADFPLADFIPADDLSTVFSNLFYTDARAFERDENVVYDVQLLFEGELKLAPPGCDAFAFTFGVTGGGWSAFHVELVIGPDFSVVIHEATVGIRISES